jgi:hypothetical protein
MNCSQILFSDPYQSSDFVVMNCFRKCGKILLFSNIRQIGNALHKRMGGRHLLRQLVIGRAPPLSRTLIVPPNYKLERTVAQVVTSLSQVCEVIVIVLKSMRVLEANPDTQMSR